jgi:hypothetical protein
MNRPSFLPRSESKLVFILVMVCFTWTLNSLLQTLVDAFHSAPAYLPGLFTVHSKPEMRVSDLLLFSPVVESLLLVAAIELLRWVGSPTWLQICGSTMIIAILHSVGWRPWALIVAPGFAVQAFSYLYWRSDSRMIAFVIVVCIHALHNLIPAISNLAYSIRYV